MNAMTYAWHRSVLGEIALMGSGGTPQAGNVDYYGGGAIPWAVIGDLNDGVVTKTSSSITDLGLARSSAKIVPEDAVLIAMYGSIGKLGIVGRKMATNQAIAFLMPRSEILSKYLFFYLLSQRQALDAAGKGATQRNISQTILKAWPITYPDLAEQRRIVDILEDHFASLDTSERCLRKASAKALALQQSVLRAGLCGSLLADVPGDVSGHEIVASITGRAQPLGPMPGNAWSRARLGDLFEIGVGSTPSRADPTLWGGDLAWVSSGEVAFSRIKSTREMIQRDAAGSPSARIHPPGTVLLAMIGEGKTRGQAAILDIEAAHNQNCASIRVSRTPVVPDFVYYFLQERYLETRSAASGGNQPALNKARVQAIEMPVPPLGTQLRLVAAFDEHRMSNDRLSESLARGLCRVSILRSAVLSAAFAGRLTGGSRDINVIEELAEEESA